MEFKQDDFVQTRVNARAGDGSTVATGSMGRVTVVGVELEDGSTNGIEVLFDGVVSPGKYACYNTTQLTLIDAPQKLEPEDRPAELKKFRTNDPQAQAIALVDALFYDGTLINKGDIYVVWFCSALQNWKALVSTNVKDNAYYEVTHNGAKEETYVDKYVKNQHYRIPDEFLED